MGNILGHETREGVIFSGLGSVVYLTTIVSLNGLFIYKLIKVYKTTMNDNSNKKLVDIITKTAILCFASTFGTMLFLSLYLLGLWIYIQTICLCCCHSVITINGICVVVDGVIINVIFSGTNALIEKGLRLLLFQRIQTQRH